jgi:hypothetical protein
MPEAMLINAFASFKAKVSTQEVSGSHRLALAADDVLIRDEVHAVARGGYDGHVSDAVQCDLLVEGDAALQPHHRLVRRGPVLAVDALHQRHRKIVQLLHVLARRPAHMCQHLSE